MDPPEGIDIHADSTFRIMLEGQSRGHTLFYCSPDDLGWTADGPATRVQAIEVRNTKGDHFTLGVSRTALLGEFDVVLLRQDPPFDMHYVTTTHLLEAAPPRTFVVNDPFWVRNAPEKLFVTRFAEFMPPTMISRDFDAIRAFRREHGDIVIKPLYGNGGEGVFRLRADDTNFNPLVETLLALRREALMVQRFVPDVLEQGDRRLILVDGDLVGGILRVPPEGETRSNLHVGGRAEPWEPGDRDREIAERVGPVLKEKGLLFAGLDVIGQHVTEINVTSPTGIQELERLGGVNSSVPIWEAIESRVVGRA